MTPGDGTDTLSLQAVPDARVACGRGQLEMQNVKVRLDAWREAEHRRDGLVLGSAERQEAEEQVRTAEKAFHAELAQTSARYAEQEFRSSNLGWSAQLDRRTSVARD
jgi:hypothetical protein